jgi:hypothetical protein
VPVEVTKIVKETVEVPVEVTKIVEKVVEVPAEEAAEAGPVTLEVFNPSGANEVTALHAARLDTLEGKTICEVSNLGWQSIRTAPYLREVLQNLYPTSTFIPYTEFPTGDIGLPKTNVAELVKQAGCDAVIVGNAG